MKYSVLEKNLMARIEESIRDVAPGVIVRSYQNGRIICDISVGTTYPYYDFASLTKIIFPVQMMMLAFESKKVQLDIAVKSFLPWFPNSKTTIHDLLTHSSGLEWWKPYYKELFQVSGFSEKRNLLKDLLSQEKVEVNPAKCTYSDLNFFVLGFVLEALYDKNLKEVWNEAKSAFYEDTTLDFNLGNDPKYRRDLYAPTEECPWRKKLIQGEVHDENAWAMDGLSSHSGLFGSIDDLSWYGLLIRSQLLGIARYKIRQKTALLFASRSVAPEAGDWALGYMMPTLGSSSSGYYLTPQSIGHTGFTGTSFWYDPKQDLNIMILSNRVLYGRENNKFKSLRPQIHNWLVEGLRKSSIM